MPGKPVGWKTTKHKTKEVSRRAPWIWIGIGVLVLVALGGFLWWQQTRPAFGMELGSRELLVLLRNDQEGMYRLRYDGGYPVDLSMLKVMLGGTIVHVDVQQVALVHDGQETVLERDGRLPDGERIQLRPGDTFDVKVTFRGRTVGGNWLYGFRIGYLLGERERTYDLELKYDYALIVR